MTLRQLEILRAVLRCHTTVAAAEMLGMSQPAVSNAIRLIETQIGFPLFERLNNRLYPTEAARQLQKESEPLFTMHAALERRMEDMRTDKVTRLWMLSTPPLGHGIIPEALRRFLRRQARLRLFFNVRELNEVVKGIESGDADLGFGLGLGSEPTLQVERLFEGRMVCVCPPGHPLARLAVVTPADLRRHSFVALDAATRMGSAVRDAFIATGQPPDFPISVHFCNTACDLVLAGVGAAVVDPFSASSCGREQVAVLPFEPTIVSVAYAFWSSQRQVSRTAQQFLQDVRQVLHESLPNLAAQRTVTATG